MTRLAVFQEGERNADGDRTYERIGSGALFVGGEFGRGVVSIFIDGGRAHAQRIYVGEDVPRDDARWIPQIDPSLTREDVNVIRHALRAFAAPDPEGDPNDAPDPLGVRASKLLDLLEGFNGPAILIAK